MEKVLVIDGKQVRFKSTASFVKRYKAQFQRNIFADFYELTAISEKMDAVNKDQESEYVDFSDLNLEIFYDIAWVLAKTADPNIPPVDEWLDTFDEFPMDRVGELIEMVMKTIESSASKKK